MAILNPAIPALMHVTMWRRSSKRRPEDFAAYAAVVEAFWTEAPAGDED